MEPFEIWFNGKRIDSVDGINEQDAERRWRERNDIWHGRVSAVRVIREDREWR